MARIILHPQLSDPLVEFSLADITARRGIADVFEEDRVVVLKDFRLPFDFGALTGLAKSTDSIENPIVRKKLKKLTSSYFLDGKQPEVRRGGLVFDDPVRQAIFDILCHGDPKIFRRAARALKLAHEEALRIFEICFPDYEPFRLVPSIRLTRTLFENLHWDNHSIEDDFHQARIFANLDERPRIWNISYGFAEFVRRHYRQYELERFAGKDPNLMIDFICGEILGGTRKTWMDNLPRHQVAFDPGEVWLGESRLISHQICYGEAALVYMWFVKKESMANPNCAFNATVERVHSEMLPREAG